MKTNDCGIGPELAGHDGLNVILTGLSGRIDWEGAGDKGAAIDAVNKSFSAVPADIQNMFLTLNGRILITDKSNELCTDVDRWLVDATSKEYKENEILALKEDLSSVKSCYLFGVPSLFKRATNKDGQLLTIVLPSDPNEIHHSLVRSVGYLVSNVFSHLIFSSNDRVVTWISEENPKFTSIKDGLSTAFLNDIQGSPYNKRFAKYLNNGSASFDEKKSFKVRALSPTFIMGQCSLQVKLFIAKRLN